MDFKKGDSVRLMGGTDVGVVTTLWNDNSLTFKYSNGFHHFTSIDNLELVSRPKEKKMVPHWPALAQRVHDSHYFISNDIYRSEEMAKDIWGKKFVRLLREFPAVMIEIMDEEE